MSIFDLFTERKSNSSDNRHHSKFNRNAVRSRNLRMESLEERALLSAVPLSSSEYADLRAQYAEFNLPENMADLNVITLDLAEGDGLTELKNAIEQAGGTEESDLIIVRTSDTANTLKYGADTDEVTIDINTTKKGSVTIVSLGSTNLTLDANQQCRVMTVSDGTTYLGGLTITNGKSLLDWNYEPIKGKGGGIYNLGTLMVTNCSISGNTVIVSGYKFTAGGGGIYNAGSLTVTNSTISGNTAQSGGSTSDSSGGGIYNYNSLTIINSTISGNIIYSSDLSRGAGIYNASGTSIITNCRITGNSATGSNNYGGGINIGAGTLTMTNSTIAGNTAGQGRSGIMVKTGVVTINNSIVVDDIHRYDGVSISGSNNLLSTNNIGGSNNFIYESTQPLFVNEKKGDYHLATNSQAIDKGNNGLALNEEGVPLAFDQEGVPRIVNNCVDIGAYEYHIGKVCTPILDHPTSNCQVVSVSWSRVENADTYQLEYKLSTDFTWTTQIVNDTSTTFTGERSSTYNIRVKALGSGYYANSNYSSEISVTLNNEPIAADDTFVCNGERFLILDVLTNDIDIDGDPLSTISITQPTAGQAIVFTDGRIFYQPDDNTENDSFTYTISDGFGGTSTATVTITAPANDQPVAQDDSARVELNGHVLIDVLANDSDPDGDPLSILNVVQPTNGTVVLSKDDKILYLPKTGFSGTDSFTYTVSDGHGGTAEATVSVEVIRTFRPLIVTPNEASPALISEWETFNVELHGAEGLAETQTIYLAWDASLFDLNTARAVSENGVSIALGAAVTENGITTQEVVLNVENTALLNEDALLASLEFLPVATDSLAAGDSSDWTISVNREALNIEVESFAFDLNDSGSVEINDLVAFARVFGQSSGESDLARIADFSGNGTVEINDLVLFARNFGKKRPSKPQAAPAPTALPAYASTPKLEEMPTVERGLVNDAAMTAYLDEME